MREFIRDENGEVIAATCVDEQLSDEASRALAALVKVAREHFGAELLDPDSEVSRKQAASRERIRERNARWAAPGAADDPTGGAS